MAVKQKLVQSSSGVAQDVLDALVSHASGLSAGDLFAVVTLVERIRSRSDEEVVVFAAPPRRNGNSSVTARRAVTHRAPTRFSFADLVVGGDDDDASFIIVESLTRQSATIDLQWKKLKPDPDLVGPDFEVLLQRNETRKFELRRRLLSDTYSAEDVAKLLGRSKQAVLNRAGARDLLVLNDGNRRRFPMWQFDASTSSGVVEGLAAVLNATGVGDFALASWLTLPNRIFEGQTPVAVLKAGRVDEVVSEARAIGPS